MELPEKIIDYVYKKISKDYGLNEDEIIEIFNEEAKKTSGFKEILERENLEHFEKNKSFKRALKSAKKRCYLLLRQHDRATVQEKEKLLDEIIESCKEFDDNCLSLHKNMMRTHVSTLKRVDIIERFYKEIFSNTGVPKSIIDIGAGINAFTLPFTGIKDLEYLGIEKKEKDVRLVKRYFKELKIENARIEKFDVESIVSEKGEREFLKLCGKEFGLCLILKTIPLLERYNRGISVKLLRIIPAKNFVISGSRVSMVKGEDIEYREKKQITQIIEESELKIIKEVKFPDEIVFICRRR